MLQIRSAMPIQDMNTSAPIYWGCDGLSLLAKIRSASLRSKHCLIIVPYMYTLEQKEGDYF
jgi:hypothetical protein